MGNSSSAVSEEGVPAAGYRVLSIQGSGAPALHATVFPSAQAARAGLRTPTSGQLTQFLDIITSVNGIPITEDSDDLAKELTTNLGAPVVLTLFNTKSKRERTVSVVPRDDWGGEGLLGAQVRFEALTDEYDACLHVVDVEPASPAAAAGLVPEDDYILGTAPLAPFASVSAFGSFIAECAGEEVPLFVLRRSTDTVRLVVLYVDEMPWGADRRTGLGVTLASGHMHTLPHRDTDGGNDMDAAPWSASPPPPAQPAAQPILAAPSAAVTAAAPTGTAAPPIGASAQAAGAAPFAASAALSAAVFAAPPPTTAAAAADASSHGVAGASGALAALAASYAADGSSSAATAVAPPALPAAEGAPLSLSHLAVPSTTTAAPESSSVPAGAAQHPAFAYSHHHAPPLSASAMTAGSSSSMHGPPLGAASAVYHPPQGLLPSAVSFAPPLGSQSQGPTFVRPMYSSSGGGAVGAHHHR